jgi:DNA-binding Xre family transcriptional regulator
MNVEIPLQSLLDRAAITLWELGNRTGIRYDRLQQYHKNTAKMLKLADIPKLCEELKCQPSDLVVLKNGNGRTKKKGQS